MASTTVADTKGSQVYLGFGYVLEPHLSFRLLSHYMPLGKVGGRPAWLNPVDVPSCDALSCRACGVPMAFLIQVYATHPDDADYSFHRTLFFFICRNSQCSMSNDASNLRAFRCTLPRYNDYYTEQALDPDSEILFADPRRKPSYPNLCEVCGLTATKKCSRCESAWYCCREHQMIDWTGAHKMKCTKQNSQALSNPDEKSSSSPENTKKIEQINGSRASTTRHRAANPFVFPEFAIEMDIEWKSKDAGDSDEESDCEFDSNDNDLSEKRMEDYRQYVKKHSQQPAELSNADTDDVEELIEKDVAFKIFNKTISLNAEQILRYERGGEPLLATDGAPKPGAVPPCVLCGSGRQFEMQLMPNLLSLIGVDDLGNSIDWATVMLYTCARNCRIPNDAYAEEFVFKQDFS